MGSEKVIASPKDKAGMSEGEVIDAKYKILKEIGGNMGLVFKAWHCQLGRVVALKLLPAHWMADPNHRARFKNEMQAMGKLEHHPNLVTATDAGSVGSRDYVVMEWIDGIDLNGVIKSQSTLSLAAACEAARQAALGLQYAHQNGLVHRDIKPSNLMLTRSGTIKVIDMGLALARGDASVQLTHTGDVLGTLAYCAPEQIRDASRVDIRADIYSLGCTLYHLLIGKAPYCERKPVLVAQAHLDGPFPKLTEALPDAPSELEEVLARMTANAREARFDTPAEVAKELERFTRGADLKPLVPPAGPDPLDVRTTQDTRLGVRWPLRRRMAVIALLLAIVGVVIFSLRPFKKGTLPNVPTPVIVLMDTTAKKGIYDTNNYDLGRSNADELYEGLAGLDGILLPGALRREGIGLDWARDSDVIAFKPDLVIIHRSSFFHPLAAIIGLKYPPDANAEEYKMFKNIYDAQDLRLRNFISLVGAAVQHCQFLVYSRGTDTNWLSPAFRTNWTATLESNITNLQGRIHTMVISNQPSGQKGTFKDTNTMAEVQRRVREMLKFPKREPEKRN